jgi:hypothetical protein
MILRFVTLLLLLVSVLWAELSQAAENVTHPFIGVTHIARWEETPRSVFMNIVLVDLAMPGIRFKLTGPSGTRDTLKETTLDFLKRQHAQIAINCHFMVPYPSTDRNVEVVGLAASKGMVYSPFEPQPIGAAYVDQSYAILPFAPALNIGQGNRVAIVHRDPIDPKSKRLLEPVKLWNTVSGSAQIVTGGVKTIPSYTGFPGGLNPLNGYSDFNSWYAIARARAVIGVTADNRTLVLFTVDEAGGSIGMTVGEAADVLISDYEVYNALNLDGGGSTTLAMQDPATKTRHIVNVPSDNPLGRAVGSSLAVFARPFSDPVCR